MTVIKERSGGRLYKFDTWFVKEARLIQWRSILSALALCWLCPAMQSMLRFFRVRMINLGTKLSRVVRHGNVNVAGSIVPI